MEWIMGNWPEIIAVLGAGHALALAVVNLTPTPADNQALARVYRVVEIAAGLFSGKAKQTGN